MKQDMVVLTNAALITCIVQRGAADDVVRAAHEAGAHGATIFHGRGTGVRQRHLGLLGLTVNAEKEIVYIVVPDDQAHRILERIFVAAKLDTPGMGIIYITPIEKLATHIPHQVAARYGSHER